MPDDAAISALRNVVWHESRLYDDLLLNRPTTLEDALHRATKYVEMEEEKIALKKKHAPAKSLTSKDRSENDYYESRQHFDQHFPDKKAR